MLKLELFDWVIWFLEYGIFVSSRVHTDTFFFILEEMFLYLFAFNFWLISVYLIRKDSVVILIGDHSTFILQFENFNVTYSPYIDLVVFKHIFSSHAKSFFKAVKLLNFFFFLQIQIHILNINYIFFFKYIKILAPILKKKKKSIHIISLTSKLKITLLRRDGAVEACHFQEASWNITF